MGADKYMSATQICCVGLVIENKIRKALTTSSSCEEGWLGVLLGWLCEKTWARYGVVLSPLYPLLNLMGKGEIM